MTDVWDGTYTYFNSGEFLVGPCSGVWRDVMRYNRRKASALGKNAFRGIIGRIHIHIWNISDKNFWPRLSCATQARAW